jgi:hypothetical protein
MNMSMLRTPIIPNRNPNAANPFGMLVQHVVDKQNQSLREAGRTMGPGIAPNRILLGAVRR